jgi:hypothetical protein
MAFPARLVERGLSKRNESVDSAREKNISMGIGNLIAFTSLLPALGRMAEGRM